MRLSAFVNLRATTVRTACTRRFLLIFSATLISPQLPADELHDQITNAIVGLASKDESTKSASIRVLLATPPEFRANIDAQLRFEAESLAESLPHRIDAYTTAQGAPPVSA